MLEVVQDEKHVPRSEESFQALEHGLGTRFMQPEYLRDRGGDEMRMSDRRQVDKEHAIAEGGEQGHRGLHPETGLARAAGSREREQSGLGLEHVFADRFELSVPPDQVRRSGWQVMRRELRGTRERPERREVGR